MKLIVFMFYLELYILYQTAIIKNGYVKYYHWHGKKIVTIEQRQYAEFLLLFNS